MASARENLAPQVVQRVAKEIRKLVQTPPNGIRYLPQDEEVLTDIHVEIAGPENTPYDGGFFLVKLTLSDGFPHAPPKGVFLTKIFHPNIATNGEICVNTLKKDWTPELGIAHVLQVIRCLLIVPFPESSLNDEAGRLFMESYDEYARRARLWTNIHAPKKSAAKNLERATVEDVENTSGCTSGKDSKATSEKPEPEARDGNSSVVSKTPTEKTAGNDTETPSASSDKFMVAPKVTTATTMTSAPATKKRTSPTSTDAAQKKKSTLKKGIKRL